MKKWPRRFSLRTMLLVVLLAAVACWWYAIGWPTWQEYRLRHFTQSIAPVTSVEVRLRTGRRFSVTWSKEGEGIVDGGIELEIDDFILLADRAVIWRDVHAASSASSPLECYLEGAVELQGIGPDKTFFAVYFDAKSNKLAVLRRQQDQRNGLVERAESLRQDAVALPRE